MTTKTRGLLFSMFAILIMVTLAPLSTAQVGAGKKVGFLWSGKSGMATRVTKGFIERIKEIAPGLDIEFQLSLKSMDQAGAVYKKFQETKDGIIFLRSNGLKYMGKNPPRIPTFCGGCNHPTALGAIKNLNKPEGNITGVTYYLPLTLQFDLYKQLVPGFKSICFLHKKGHPGTAIEQGEARKICKKRGITYHAVVANTQKELVLGLAKFAKKVDMFVIGNQALVMDKSKTIRMIAGKTPVMSLAGKPLSRKDAGAGLVPNDHKLGRMLADSVASVVVHGKKIKDTAIKTDPNPKLVINTSTLAKTGITVSKEMQKILARQEAGAKKKAIAQPPK